MKIIAQAEKGTYLISATEDEVARLIGYRDEFSYRCNSGQRPLGVGTQINVNGMYSRLYRLEERKGELERLAKQLRAQADLLESVDPIIAAAVTAEDAPS